MCIRDRFEIVLNQSETEYVDEWIPHFHIDIDTTLDYSEIKSITNSVFWEGFINWNIDVPHYGVVLGMGSLGSVNGTKIYLGLGTKLRDTDVYKRQVVGATSTGARIKSIIIAKKIKKNAPLKIMNGSDLRE